MTYIYAQNFDTKIYLAADTLCLTGEVRTIETKARTINTSVGIALSGAFQRNKIEFFNNFVREQSNSLANLNTVTNALILQLSSMIIPSLRSDLMEELSFVVVGFNEKQPICRIIRATPMNAVSIEEHTQEGWAYHQGIPEAQVFAETLLPLHIKSVDINNLTPYIKDFMQKVIQNFPDKLGSPITVITLNR